MTAYQVIKDMKNAGLRATIVPAESVRDIRVEMESLIVSGALDAGIVAKYGRHFQNDFISRYPAARSIILVAAPCPVHRLTFSYHGTCCEAVIPPGYARMGLKSAVEHQVSGLLRQSGYSCEKLEGVPLKLIAVKSGLCLYGRNNITYCEGLGSYIRLFGFVSDIQAPQDALWRPAERMPECADCGACIHVCPNGCIGDHSKIIRAERCLTYLNENGGDFPDWLNPDSHNAVIGCMLCQKVCPKNRGLLKTQITENAFEETEVDAILSGGTISRLSEKTQKTLRDFDLDEFLPWVLARNFRAILNHQTTSKT